MLMAYFRKHKSASSNFNLTNFHLEQARKWEQEGNFEKAYKDYKSAFRISQKHESAKKHSEVINEYEGFVRRDPNFKKIADAFIAGIKKHPEIKVSDITLGNQAKAWGEEYGLGKPLEPVDINYFFSFAEKFGYLTIDNNGKIFLEDNVNEI